MGTMSLARAETPLESPRWDDRRTVTNLDGLPVAVWEVRGAPDRAGYVRYLNTFGAELFGLDAEPDLGTAAFWDRIIHRDDRDEFVAKLQGTWQSGKPVVTRVRCLRGNGESFRSQVNATAVLDADSRAVGVRGIVVDISMGQRRVHRRIADADILGVLFWNSEGQITGANDVFVKMLGYTRDDVRAGRIEWDRLTPPEYAERDRTVQAHVLRGGAAAPSEKEFYHRDGSRVHALVGTASFDDESGSGISCVLDLTPYKCRVREAQTLAQLSQHALTADSSSILSFAASTIRQSLQADAAAIFLRDKDQYRMVANDGLAADSCAHFTSEYGPQRRVEHWSSETRLPWTGMLAEQGILSGVTVSVEQDPRVQLVVGVYHKRPRAFVQEELTFLQAAANLLSSAVYHKQTMEALAAQEQWARQNLKLEALGRLAGGIAHDFNNLLTAIMGYADLAMEKSSTSRSEIDEIRHAANSAADLVRQLLAFSRKQVLEARPLNLNKAVADVQKILRRLIPEDIDLCCRLSPDPVIIHADAVQIEQVIMNLVLNARDAIKENGQITVSVATVPGEKLAQLCVADTGVGMDETTREHLFEPFFTTKEVGKGTGLGLATVYGIIQQSGGTVAVQSEPGRGSIFTVVLPLTDKHHSIAALSADLPGPPAGTESVLLVEDQDNVRRSLTAGLAALGYEVLPAASPSDAIEIARSPSRRIDALVTDIVMPFMNGKSLAAHICALRPNIPTVFISGYPLGHEAMVADVMAKPFHCYQLAARLREVIDHN